MHKESDSPWAKVLKTKYSNPRKTCSRTWSTMKKGKEVFVQDTKWVVGANSSLNFWHDKWLNEGSLRSLIARPLNRGEDQLEMGEVTQKGGWNFSYCSFVFPCGLLQRIKAILIPYLDASLDNISWDYSNYGEFDGRSAYKLAKGESNVTDEFARSWIWKVDTLPKIQCFIWKSYLFSLPAKDLLVTGGIAEDSKCEGCGREAETIIHVLRDCDIAKKFWLDTGNGRCDNNFFTSDLCSWLKENLRSSTDLVEANVP